MFFTESEVVEFINDNDVKFIRLAFCDIYGTQKNISIMPSQLERAFSQGISIDASAVEGFGSEEKSDLFLFPDPSTLSLLPWRPSHGRVVRFFCNIKYPDGTPFELDSRYILSQAVQTATKQGYSITFGAECEFYLFKSDENGYMTDIPFDRAGYMDIAPADKGENIRRDICLTLEEMDILVESSHHEQGPGQNEIVFKYDKALAAADSLTTFKSVVKTISSINGVCATFSPKPIKGAPGNGLHINMAPYKIVGARQESIDYSAFMAGILENVSDMTAFLNPSEQSFERFGAYKAPVYITWSVQNRSQLIRIPAEQGEYSRIELRSPDPLANPYIAYALLIYAGLEGINNKLKAPQPLNINLYTAPASITQKLKKLPDSYEKAAKLAHKSKFINKYLPKRFIDAYTTKENH